MIWEQGFRDAGRSGSGTFDRIAIYLPHYLRQAAVCLLILLLFLITAAPVPWHKGKKDVVHYGMGLIVNIPFPEQEVTDVVEEVVQNTIIRGTKEYNTDEYVSKAVSATSTPVFPKWTEDGKVFYKVREQALDPRNFKDSTDLGTLAVRYVVKPQGDKNTILRIDALFVEDVRRSVHLSNGSVESAEYKDIEDHLQEVELVKKETEEALREKEERAAKQKSGAGRETISESNPSATANNMGSSSGARPAGEKTADHAASASVSQSSALPQSSTISESSPVYDSGASLEQHVAQLRQQLERLVKKPGAPLQSAPFHTASTLLSLQPGTQVLIVISTPYWYGVETHDGQHGWIRRDELEQVP